MTKPRLLGLGWRGWQPRWSLRCSLGFHKFLSYTTEPWKFKCHRCGKNKDYPALLDRLNEIEE